MENAFVSYGLGIGIMIGLVIALIFFKYGNTDHKVMTEYDERQKTIRGKGYMLAFYTLLIYDVVTGVLRSGGFRFPVKDILVSYTGIILSCTVLGAYCIWKGAYWGMNNNKKRYAVLLAVCIVLNAIPVVRLFMDKGSAEGIFESVPMVNLLVLLMLGVCGIAYLARKIADKNADASEE